MTSENSKFRSLPAGFVDSAKKFPNRPALEVTGETITYESLFEYASSIAASIQASAQPAKVRLTAVLAHRSRSAFTGILGALLSEHGYIPLNPNFPAERTATMLNTSGATSLVVGSESIEKLSTLLPRVDLDLVVLLPDTQDTGLLQKQFSNHTFVGEHELRSSSAWTQSQSDPADIAYLLFTSGSTGQPKGVPITHSNIRHFVDSVTSRYGINEHDRFSQMFELVFDLSIFDMFVAWECGACLCCPSRDEAQIPARYIKNSNITVWFSVPSLALHMKQMRMLRTNAFPNLRISLFCGEALLGDVVQAWSIAAPNSSIENLYGPTEVTLACTAYSWDRNSSPAECQHGLVPIGRPLPGLTFIVADENLDEVATGASGELLMAGPQVAPGYWHDEQRTADAFVTPPGQDEIYYRTGDLVERPKDDDPIKYVGRLDHQIKIRGNRVELGEIEAAIRDIADVGLAVAVGWPVSPSGADAIVAFLQSDPTHHDLNEIRRKLGRRLPAHMMPKEYQYVDEIPLNPNGKVDRKALVQMLEQGEDQQPALTRTSVTAPKKTEDECGIVVLGCPRSGTTVMRRILDAHPRIACPGETCILSAAARFLHSEVVSDGLEFGVLNGLAFAGFKSDEILGRLRDFVFAFHQDHARAQNKPRWAEKTAVDVFHLSQIEQICGDHVQYVCVVRHGLDVACSLREFSERGYTYLSEIHEYVQRNPRPLEAFTQAWVDATESILEFQSRHAQNALLIRYEDFVAHPQAECQRLFDFLGEDWTNDTLPLALEKSNKSGLGDWKAYSAATIDSQSVQRWRSLPPGVVSTLAQICNPTLEACGYEPIGIQPPLDQDEARRRYNLALTVGLGKSETNREK